MRIATKWIHYEISELNGVLAKQPPTAPQKMLNFYQFSKLNATTECICQKLVKLHLPSESSIGIDRLDWSKGEQRWTVNNKSFAFKNNKKINKLDLLGNAQKLWLLVRNNIDQFSTQVYTLYRNL